MTRRPKPPRWMCTKCDWVIEVARLPLSPSTRVPICPTCRDWRYVDVAFDADMVLGDSGDVIGKDDMVIWTDKREDERNG